MTNKMTNRKALLFVLENYHADLPDDVREKLEGMAASLEKKSSNSSDKPTAKQVENAGLRDQILEFMRSQPNQLFTCTEIGKAIPALEGMNNQRISALMRALVSAELVEKTTVKGKSVFQIAAVED